jgi:hypothetical protein
VALPSQRAKTEGPAKYVDAAQGRNNNPGTEAAPWQSIRHALTQLQPDDTLYLRSGVFYENVTVSLAGRVDAPITIRSYPGEQAIIDGGLREFFEVPADAWEPFANGAAGEFQSKRPFPNVRNAIGAFGDSMIGLQTYYHAIDLRATNELVEANEAKTDIQPLWCGPGLWYDPQTGHIHVRLQHTHLPGIANYAGETDPRKLPLVIAPFRSVPLHLDEAQHVRFQDLVIRGGGYDTVVLNQASDIEFDNVTVWCGTYGLRATGTRRLKFLHSALYGSIAPWTTRFESGFNTYPGRTQRDITRLNTHALLVTDAGREFSVYHSPFNDDWEIAHSEFTEGSDGLYLGGVGLRFHHNLVSNMQDDGIYLSPMYERHKIFGGGATLYFNQNYFSRCLTMLAFGGAEENHDTVYFYRNIVDLRAPILTGRPQPGSNSMIVSTGKVTGDHGSPPWSAMNTYQNTFVVASTIADSPDLWMARGATPERPRKVFNNIFLHLGRLATPRPPDTPALQLDANLYWQPRLEPQQAATFFDTFRKSPAFTKSKEAYPPGFDANSLAADPKFLRAESDAALANDYRLHPDSSAIDAGITLPPDWPDPLREHDVGKPDLGAVPNGTEMWNVGRTDAK